MQTKSHADKSVKLTIPAQFKGCIFICNPFPECYCMNITSSKIPKILAYCTGDFNLCGIYCDKMEAKIK
jgi:hypothetical protein